MSTGLTIAIRAVPFLDLVDREVDAVVSDRSESDRASLSPESRMDASRRRLAEGLDAFVRSLPASIRNDTEMCRAAAYALVGLADERMLHHPGGETAPWRNHLLEYHLYGSALAGQEIVARARASTYGAAAGSVSAGESALLAPLYLGVFRAGFEGGLRDDSEGLSALIAALEDTVGTGRRPILEAGAGIRPRLAGTSSTALMIAGVVAWLASGVVLWSTLPQNALREADYIAGRITAGLTPRDGMSDPLERSIGPSGLPPFRNPLLLIPEELLPEWARPDEAPSDAPPPERRPAAGDSAAGTQTTGRPR